MFSASKRIFRLGLLIASSWTLAACGGSGSGNG
jgi:predicted small lipoprotein YifL